MKPKNAELLLVFYLFLPIVSIANSLIALTIISQIQAIYMVRQQERRFGTEEDDGAMFDFWRALWLDPNNSAAYAYIGVSRLCPVFLSHQNGDRITSSGFTLIGQAIADGIVQLKITFSLPLLGGLLKMGEQTFIEGEICTDTDGRFQVQVPELSDTTPGTRYTIYAIASREKDIYEATQITLIQA